MDQTKRSFSPEKMVWVWFMVGIGLAIAFIVIGSVFFGLKPGAEPTTSTSGTSTTPETEEVNPSLYAPSSY